VILDTDILIDLDREFPPAVAWLSTLPELPPISGFAALELKAGCPNKADMRKVTKFLKPFPIVWPTEADMVRALVEYAPLRLSHGLGILDSLIAATAVGMGEPVATFNNRHFRGVPGLATVQPYTR
jgi:predicted nucleic acid-binding protein